MFLGDEMMFQTEANTNFVDHKVEQCQAVEAEILGLVPTTRRVARLAFYLLPLPFPWTKLLIARCYHGGPLGNPRTIYWRLFLEKSSN